MSTPTTANPSQPSSASKKTAGHVTTPSHLGGLSSPAPRSVPSPAAVRKDQAGKTPINHPTVSSQGSKTLGSTPMVQSLSQTGMTVSSSPGQNPGFGTPSGLVGLGVDMGSVTPGQLNIAPPFVGGTSMIPTMSDLGFSTSGGKRNEDEERRTKMRKVLKSIGKPKGRVSEEGIARLSRRLGFQNDIDGDSLSAAERARVIGNRDLAIAGAKVSVEVKMKEQRVQDLKASIYPLEIHSTSLPSPIVEQSVPASRVLSSSLAVPSGISLHSSLDRFAVSLHSLAQIDKISAAGGVNCFEALNGLYKSLQKLHDIEVAALALKPTTPSSTRTDRSTEREVLCRRSGKASFDDSAKIGLTLWYWNGNPEPAATSDDAMDIDKHDETELTADNHDDIFCFRIGAEECPATIYPPLRVSDAWLPENIEADAALDSGIPWQQPPPTYIPEPANSQTTEMTIDGAQRLPNIRFTATLDPPVVMPYPTILNILSSVGVQQPPQVLIPEHYHAVLLDIPVQTVQAGTPTQVKQTVLSHHDGQEISLTHDYTLDILKSEYGYKLETIPFSHPRQLIELLPTLRQWAHFGALLRAIFVPFPSPSPTTPLPSLPNVSAISLDDILAPTAQPPTSPVQVSIGLATSPHPTLTVTHGNLAGSAVRSTLVQFLPNAEIFVADLDAAAKDGAGAPGAEAKTCARALEVAGDLGVWIEWMRMRG